MTVTFGFGELQTETWGVGRVAPEGDANLTIGSGGHTASLRARVAAGTPGEQSQTPAEQLSIEAEGLELTLVPTAQSLCRARGRLVLAGHRREIDCPGWRQTEDRFPDADWGSLRQLMAWFSHEDGLALLALRPARARAHAEDLISAEILGPERIAVEDARLSTTYDRDGRVSRAGLELWLGGAESDELHAVRAAGEAVGPAGGWSEPGVSFAARLLRWHSRGREGAGVYLLGHRR